MKLIMFMDFLETDTKLVFILEKITMKSFLQVQLLVLFKILQHESKNFSVELRRKKMQKNISKDSHTIKMTLQLQMQLVERQEILLLQENVVKCQLYMSGIISLCNQLETFNWELKRKVLLPSLSVHAKDMLLLSIKAMIILCISIMFREKKCFFNLLLEMMPFLIFNGLKNQMILDLLLFLLELFNFGIQLIKIISKIDRFQKLGRDK